LGVGPSSHPPEVDERTVIPEIVRVPDEELTRLAQEGGPLSVEARVLRELGKRRAKDRQVYVFRVGDYYFTGPIPDARTEIALLELAEDDGDE
jgi:hypothetical protein